MQDTDKMNFAEKKAFYLAEIERIPVTAYNAEQKALASFIIERADERNLDALYTFITRRVKLGFVFDAAPEVNHNACALVKRDAALSFEAAELSGDAVSLSGDAMSLSGLTRQSLEKDSRVKRGNDIDEKRGNDNNATPVRHSEARSAEESQNAQARNEMFRSAQHDINPAAQHDKNAAPQHDGLFETPIRHKLIVGENFDALKNLAVCYRGAVDFIYIDPPYNTESTQADGNDYKSDVQSAKFCYRDKFSRTGYLNMMRERLALARRLLSERGAIFISIDDSEQAYLKVLCDEIFGEENFYGQFIQLKGNTQNDSKSIQKNHEYILCYVRQYHDLLLTYENGALHKVFEDKYYLGRDTGASSGHDTLTDRNNLGYTIYYYEGTGNGITGNHNTLTDRNNLGYNDFKVFKKGGKILHAIAINDYSVENLTENSKENEIYKDDKYLLSLGYKIIRPPKRRAGQLGCWTWGKETFKELWNKDEVLIKNDKNVIKKEYVDAKDIIEKNGVKYYVKKNILPPQSVVEITNSAGTTNLESIIEGGVFSNPKNPELIKHFLRLATNAKKDAIVLDFFAGSGTTAQAVMELNAEDGGRRVCILATNNENGIASRVTRERLFRVTHGQGSKGESIKWKYSDKRPFLAGNALDAFRIETHHLEIEDYEKAERLVAEARKTFPILREGWTEKDEFSIYDDLASLKPCEE